MRVFLEPFLRPPTVLVAGHGRVSEEIARLSKEVGFRVMVDDPGATKECFPTADLLLTTNLDFSETPLEAGTYLVVATQHKGDDLYLEHALRSGSCRYIGLLASRHRTDLVLDKLRARGVSPEQLLKIRAPAGLFLGGIGPTEIALSIVAEMVALRRSASIAVKEGAEKAPRDQYLRRAVRERGG
jgi:xanthine dehydrogenase accessory factor